MNTNNYCVLLAGGLGSSFWPITNKKTPKQFLDLLGCGKTFIRQSYERMILIFDNKNIYIITNKEHAKIVYEQIPEIPRENILLEPLSRNTASTVAYATFKINSINPNAIISYIPSSHYITNDAAYLADLKKSSDFVETHKGLVSIGITPSRVETNYGYIQSSVNIDKIDGIVKVKTFTEKPNIELAKIFYESKEFLWNSGIVTCKAITMLDEYKEHMPNLYNLFAENNQLGTENEDEFVENVYEIVHNISVSNAILERSSDVYVLSGGFGWSDLATWKSFYSKSDKDDNLNINSNNKAYFNDAHGCIVKTNEDKHVIIQGIDNIIVAENGKFLLICDRKDEDKIKQFEKIFRLKE